MSITERFKDFDFAVTEYTSDIGFALSTIAAESESWFGIKQVDTGFDNVIDLELFADYYGGGCGVYKTIHPEMSEKEGINIFYDLLLGTLKFSDCSYDDETTIIVKNKNKKNTGSGKKYTMIITSEDERYGEKGLSFFSDNPWEGNLEEVIFGDDFDALFGNGRNEGLFYQLYCNESGKRIGSGSLDPDSPREEIQLWEEKCREAENEKVTIRFHVECFDRYLNVQVRRVDEKLAHEIMCEAYDSWIECDNETVECECCEEYICKSIRENRIEFDYEYEMSDENKLEFIKQLLFEEENKSAGFCEGCDGYKENVGKIEALNWALKALEEQV